MAREVGVSADTLERWRSQALAQPAQQRTWTAAARLEAVITTAALDEAARNAWCREHGVYPQQLAQWRSSATQASSESQAASAVRGAAGCGCSFMTAAVITPSVPSLPM